MRRMSQRLVLFVPTLQFLVNIEHPQQQNWSDSSRLLRTFFMPTTVKVSSKLTMRLNFKVEPLIYPSVSFTCNVGKISSRWTKVGYILLPFSDKPHITTHFLLNVDLQSPLKQSLEIPPSFSQMQKSAQLVLRVIICG